MSSSPEHRSPDHRDGRAARTTLTAERAQAAVPAYLDADLRTSPYAASAIGSRSIDPRMVDHRLQPAFLAAVAEASIAGRAEGHQEGYAAGYAEGMARAAREREAAVQQEQLVQKHQEMLVSQAVSALSSAAHATLTHAMPVFEALEDAVVQAAVDVAALIVGQALPPELVATAALHRALSLAESSGPLHARMHPDSVAIVTAVGVGDDRVKLTADATLAPGDCVLEDGHALIDATLAGAIERVRAELSR
jgi:flagellar assembly protein FliH